MKNTKTKIIAIASLGFFTTSLAFAETTPNSQTGAIQEISSIGVTNTGTTATGVTNTGATTNVEYSILSSSFIDAKNIAIKLSDSIKEVGENSTISIFENTILNSVTQNPTSSGTVDIELKENLIAGKLYNLVSNVETENINGDFSYNGDKIEVLPNAKGIKEIKLVDQNKIQIILEKTPTKVDLTILKDVGVEKFVFENGTLNVTLKESVKNATKYILLSTLLDNSGKEIPISNFIYDFNSSENLIPTIQETQTGSLETLTESGTISEDNSIEKVAMTATETPATGTSTNILILLTLLTSGLLFAKNKKTIKS